MRPFSPLVRRSLLTVHVLVSAGWLGSVLAFLVIAAAGASSPDPATVTALYWGLRILIWWAIVPLSLLALITGVVQSLGTPWGLFRHYWVLFKLVLNVGSVLLLALHTQVVDQAASASGHNLDAVRQQLVVDSAAALVVLALITVLAVVKPRGVTGWGRRAADSSRTGPAADSTDAGGAMRSDRLNELGQRGRIP